VSCDIPGGDLSEAHKENSGVNLKKGAITAAGGEASTLMDRGTSESCEKLQG